MQEKID
jgi:hypothetical protein